MAPYEKVIFLDIDGVLVNRHTIGLPLIPRDRVKQRHHTFDEQCVEILNFITRKTGAVFVISSSWRHGNMEEFNDLCEYIKEQGVIGEIVGRTCRSFQIPNDKGELTGRWSRRGHEIQKWLDESGPATKFAIIDDDSDMEHLMWCLVKTTFDKGLEKRHVDPVLALLGT